MSSEITPQVLKALLASEPAPVVIHVLPEEDFQEAHLPSARCFCVYESAFIPKMAEAYPNKSTALVVYGSGDTTIEAETAVAKLNAAGYFNVKSLTGGLRGWKEAGGGIDGTGPCPTPPLTGTYSANLAKSVIYWTGRNLFNHHHGSITLSNGAVELRNDKIVSTRFTVDMNSITCEDLKDSAMNAALIGHLKSNDFFDVSQHPSAEFVATAVDPLPACTPGSNTHQVAGQFQLRAEFDFDRTLWGAVYGSGKFFAKLAQHVVNDLVHLHLKIHLEPVGGTHNT